MQGANFLKNRVQENYASTLTKQRKYNIFMLLYSLIFSLILYFQSSKMYAHGLELLQSARASAQPTPLPWPPLNVRNSKPTTYKLIWASECESIRVLSLDLKFQAVMEQSAWMTVRRSSVAIRTSTRIAFGAGQPHCVGVSCQWGSHPLLSCRK